MDLNHRPHNYKLYALTKLSYWSILLAKAESNCHIWVSVLMCTPQPSTIEVLANIIRVMSLLPQGNNLLS